MVARTSFTTAAMAGAAAATAAAVLLLLMPAVRITVEHGLSLLVTGRLGQFQRYLNSFGIWGPLVSIGFLLAQSLFVPVPVTVLLVANGLAFGLWPGTLVSIAGASAGALAAYAVGRIIGRALLERLLPGPSVRWADQLMKEYGAWAIVVNRWLPGVPLDPVSYVAGLTRLPVLWFLALTVIGLVPATIATAYLGSQIAGDVPLEYWIGILLIACGIWFGWRVLRRYRARSERSITAA
jgi:uncharacterized membrane protein YdjX (TVP38/TMEM64 family)